MTPLLHAWSRGRAIEFVMVYTTRQSEHMQIEFETGSFNYILIFLLFNIYAILFYLKTKISEN